MFLCNFVIEKTELRLQSFHILSLFHVEPLHQALDRHWLNMSPLCGKYFMAWSSSKFDRCRVPVLEFKRDGGSSDRQPEQSGRGETGVRRVGEKKRREVGRGREGGRHCCVLSLNSAPLISWTAPSRSSFCWHVWKPTSKLRQNVFLFRHMNNYQIEGVRDTMQ